MGLLYTLNTNKGLLAFGHVSFNSHLSLPLSEFVFCSHTDYKNMLVVDLLFLSSVFLTMQSIVPQKESKKELSRTESTRKKGIARSKEVESVVIL